MYKVPTTTKLTKYRKLKKNPLYFWLFPIFFHSFRQDVFMCWQACDYALKFRPFWPMLFIKVLERLIYGPHWYWKCCPSPRGIAWFLIEDQAKEKKTLTRSLGVMLKRNELSRSSKNFIRIKEWKWM